MLERIRNFMNGRSEQEKLEQSRLEQSRKVLLNSRHDKPKTLVPSQDAETSKEQNLRRRALELQQRLLDTTPPNFAKTFFEVFKLSPQTYAESIPRRLQEASKSDSYTKIEDEMRIILSLLAKASAETAYGSPQQNNQASRESAGANK